MIYYSTKKNDSDFLIHHGVLGMHWGIRRYQNKDGTLTEEGKRRYSTNLGFKSKVDNLKTKDALESKGVKGIENYLARRYMTKTHLTGNKLSEKDAVQKAQNDARVIKTVIGIAGGIAAAGLSATVPAVVVGFNTYNRIKAGIESDSSALHNRISQWNSMSPEEQFAELESRLPKRG